MYCDCFRLGNLCQDCNCLNCQNFEGSHTREKAVKKILDKDANAFKPKFDRVEKMIGSKSGRKTKSKLVHSKGCKCKKSNCLKKYCECHQRGAFCSSSCRCIDCHNRDPNSLQNSPASKEKIKKGQEDLNSNSPTKKKDIKIESSPFKITNASNRKRLKIETPNLMRKLNFSHSGNKENSIGLSSLFETPLPLGGIEDSYGRRTSSRLRKLRYNR